MATQKRGLFMIQMFACTLLLLTGTLMVCQERPQNQNPASTSAQASPENWMEAQPVQALLQDKGAANEHIQSNLQSALDDDPMLSGAEVATKVDDENISLTGSVQSYRQHARVMELVSAYSRYRNVVDKVTVQ